MKKHYILFLLLLSIIKTEAQNWVLVWFDEFSSVTIDTSKWNFEIGTGINGWGNNELEYYTNHQDNATINNGNLLIIAKQEQYGGCNYTSARMNTNEKFFRHNIKYGKIEARIKLPMTQGTWPAFWLLGENFPQVQWPRCGEIDIMEHVNNDTNIYSNMFWMNNNITNSYMGHMYCTPGIFHTYSVQWNSQAIQWFVDGNFWREKSIANNIDSTQAFHLPFYIILNLAVAGNWPGNPDSTSVFPDTLFVDYVRLYKDTLDSGLKNNKKTGNNIHVFPNPGSSIITIEIETQNKNEASYLSICNMHGQELIKRQIKTSKFQIDISNLASGIYFAKLSNDKIVEVIKILRE
jgi:beta-glucanase (GH16 family)